jgi:hypothetical protein
MKHKYIKPETEVIRLNAETMMAMSDRIPMEDTPDIPAAREKRSLWDDKSDVWENKWGI